MVAGVEKPCFCFLRVLQIYYPLIYSKFFMLNFWRTFVMYLTIAQYVYEQASPNPIACRFSPLHQRIRQSQLQAPVEPLLLKLSAADRGIYKGG